MLFWEYGIAAIQPLRLETGSPSWDLILALRRLRTRGLRREMNMAIATIREVTPLPSALLCSSYSAVEPGQAFASVLQR